MIIFWFCISVLVSLGFQTENQAQPFICFWLTFSSNTTNNLKELKLWCFVKKLIYVKLNAILWGCVQQQQTKIEHLEASVYELQEAVKELIKPKPKPKPKPKKKSKDKSDSED